MPEPTNDEIATMLAIINKLFVARLRRYHPERECTEEQIRRPCTDTARSQIMRPAGLVETRSSRFIAP